ncbi:hypothetical protein TcasGA2_TC004321 [Tribolium castaneum]|uniref:Uncharacterized protein n=1 Tax=Tribolium castaneum TaxID=7070 RepID=D6X133_TRICA|nr:hypothetical protein TcasGA2_TC004321 [Tribolium castaneum]
MVTTVTSKNHTYANKRGRTLARKPLSPLACMVMIRRSYIP